MNVDAGFVFDTTKPTGPYNRVSDLTRCRELLGWEPQVDFKSGLRSTIDWYVGTHDAEAVARDLDHMLTERKHG
jgi:nucleoside-diphosphate-sugar epimerase